MPVWDPREPLGGNTPEQIDSSRVILWKGHCSVHQMFKPDHVEQFRRRFPGSKILVHPECMMQVVDAADLVGSTEFIIKTIEQAPAGSTWGVGTELHLVNRLAQENPDKCIHFLSPMVCMCATMYRIDMPHLAWCLENLARGTPVNRIKVAPRDGALGEARPRANARGAMMPEHARAKNMAVKPRRPPRPTIDLIVHANHWDPFSVLGMHELATDAGGKEVLGHPGVPARGAVGLGRRPDARRAGRAGADGADPPRRLLRRASSPTGPRRFPYRLRVENHEGHSWEFVDPYFFGPVLTDFDLHLLGEGTHYRNYERLGAHIAGAPRVSRASISRSGHRTRSGSA